MQTVRQMNGQTDIQTIDVHTDRYTYIQRWTERQTDRYMERQTRRYREGWADRQTHSSSGSKGKRAGHVKIVIKKMTTKGSRIDFMFLAPPLYTAAGSATAQIHGWMGRQTDRQSTHGNIDTQMYGRTDIQLGRLHLSVLNGFE